MIVFGVPIGSMAGAYFLLQDARASARLVVDRANDVVQWVRTQWAVRCSVILVVGMAFLYLHLELNRTLGYLFDPCRLPVLTLLWVGMCLLLLRRIPGQPEPAGPGRSGDLRRWNAGQAGVLRPALLGTE